MHKKLLSLVIILYPFFSRAQQSDFEKGLTMMEKQGQIRREGNKIIFLNQRPGDTAFMREMYNKMLEKTDKTKNPYTIAFEVGPQYQSKTPLKNPPVVVKKDTVKTYVYTPQLMQANT